MCVVVCYSSNGKWAHLLLWKHKDLGLCSNNYSSKKLSQWSVLINCYILCFLISKIEIINSVHDIFIRIKGIKNLIVHMEHGRYSIKSRQSAAQNWLLVWIGAKSVSLTWFPPHLSFPPPHNQICWWSPRTGSSYLLLNGRNNRLCPVDLNLPDSVRVWFLWLRPIYLVPTLTSRSLYQPKFIQAPNLLRKILILV